MAITKKNPYDEDERYGANNLASRGGAGQRPLIPVQNPNAANAPSGSAVIRPNGINPVLGNPPVKKPANAQGANPATMQASGPTVNVSALAAQMFPQNGNPSTDDLLASAYQNLNAYQNGKFEYDFNLDPVYQQMRDSYLRQGRMNARDVAAQAAALTGGYGNSYGTVAAQSVMNQAAERINDAIPDLQNAAYARWADQQGKDLNLAQMYYNMYGDQYQRELNDAVLRAQYEDYSGLNARGIDTSAYEQRIADEDAFTNWKRDQEKKDAALQEALTAADYLDFSKLQDLGYDTSAYQQNLADEAAWKKWIEERTMTEAAQADEDRLDAKEEKKFARALTIATTLGDFRGLREFGLNVDDAEFEYKFNMAMTIADKLGDFSLLEDMGLDTSYVRLLQDAKIAGLFGTGGSGGGSGGGTRSSNPGYDYGDDYDETPEDLYDSVQAALMGDTPLADSAATAAGYNGQHDYGHHQDDSSFGQYLLNNYPNLVFVGERNGVFVVKEREGSKTYKYKYDASTGQYRQLDADGKFI